MKALKVQVLKLSLHNSVVGYLLGYREGRNVFVFADEYKADLKRPSLSITTHPKFPNAHDNMQDPWVTRQRLHPVLSNLLPEGALRDYLAQSLKTHVDNEFDILAHLGQDLPGALIATSMQPEDVPPGILEKHLNAQVIEYVANDNVSKFSLAGVQMKFSMSKKDGRFNVSNSNEMGNWIIKTPSTKHPFVPYNEYTAMRLAELAGVDIPEIQLVLVSQLDNLPAIRLPDEDYAFAIKRFDRIENETAISERVHMEDFAQVLAKYAHEKYGSANYRQIGEVIYKYSKEGLIDIKKYIKRLLVNILLANGDAHLKNWSLIFQDKVNPRLSPAYDILTTSVYVNNEKEFALNLAKTKNWFEVSKEHFHYLGNKLGVPEKLIELSLNETIDQARSLWPHALKELPMHAEHKKHLQAHWKKLHKDFRI